MMMMILQPETTKTKMPEKKPIVTLWRQQLNHNNGQWEKVHVHFSCHFFRSPAALFFRKNMFTSPANRQSTACSYYLVLPLLFFSDFWCSFFWLFCCNQSFRLSAVRACVCVCGCGSKSCTNTKICTENCTSHRNQIKPNQFNGDMNWKCSLHVSWMANIDIWIYCVVVPILFSSHLTSNRLDYLPLQFDSGDFHEYEWWVRAF